MYEKTHPIMNDSNLPVTGYYLEYSRHLLKRTSSLLDFKNGICPPSFFS